MAVHEVQLLLPYKHLMIVLVVWWKLAFVVFGHVHMSHEPPFIVHWDATIVLDLLWPFIANEINNMNRLPRPLLYNHLMQKIGG